MALGYSLFMQNANDKQVIDIALEILSQKEKVFGRTIPYVGNPVSVSTSEVITRLASKGIHASVISVAMALHRNLTRTESENSSPRWTV